MTGFGIFSCQDEDCNFSSNTFTVVGYNGFVAEGPDEFIYGGADGNFAQNNQPLVTTSDSLMIFYQAVVAPFVADHQQNHSVPGWLSGAFANDCVNPNPIQMTNFIDSVYIESNADYSLNLPAGSDLINIFSIRQFNEDVGFLTEARPVPEFLAQNTAIRATSFAIYRPTQAPTADKTHRFYISVWHLNGQQYDFTTGEIVFP